MTDLPASITVSNLRDECHFASTIADRGWSAWWTESDVTLTDYLRGVQIMCEGEGIPCAFVAHAGQQYAGSVLLIADDLESRPTYTPWIAALWVEPAFRRQGVAARLLQAARNESLRLGHGVTYLCAIPSKCPYYLARGFRVVERDVEDMNVLAI